ncbi:MAG: phosphoribosyltransferase family protein [Puniceicoccaceae bacterium]
MNDAFTNPNPPRRIADAGTVSAQIGRMTREIERSFPEPGNLIVVGIANGGIPFAEIIHQRLEDAFRISIPLGVVDVLFQRDDIGSRPIPRVTTPTHIDANVENAHILLCDDVIHSGRTARAALNEIFGLGRPSRITLIVLADRGNRKLPIQPDHVGLEVDIPDPFRVSAALDPSSAETWSIFTS